MATPPKPSPSFGKFVRKTPRPVRNKTAPTKLVGPENATCDKITSALKAVGLTVVQKETKKLVPELEVRLTLGQDLSKGLLSYTKPVNLSLRVKTGELYQWQESCKLILGPHVPINGGGIQFKMEGAAVTLFENTTLFVQGERCVQFMTDTFPRIREEVYSPP